MAKLTRAALRARNNDRRMWGDAVKAAQATYEPHPEYGLSDKDMEAAIRAAMAVIAERLDPPAARTSA